MKSKAHAEAAYVAASIRLREIIGEEKAGSVEFSGFLDRFRFDLFSGNITRIDSKKKRGAWRLTLSVQPPKH